MLGLSLFSHEDGWENSASSHTVLFSNEQLVVTVNSTYEYPYSIRSTAPDTVLVLEGKVYDRSTSALFDSIQQLLSSEDELEKYLFDTDGEFYLYVLDLPSHTLKVFGDHLNRLPLYHGSRNGRWIVSRDIGFVQGYLQAPINPLHLAEFLVFDYNLSTHTLFDQVFHLQLHEKLLVDVKAGKITATKRSYSYDFSAKSISQVDEVALDGMASVFLTACKQRATAQNILSLSGGMDSRSVAAGLHKGGARVTGVTFEDEEKSATTDVVIAQEIAASLQLDWQKISLNTANFREDIAETIRFKMGIQPTRYYYLNQFCRKVFDRYGGNITFFTGDGGDKVFPDLTNNIRYSDNKKLVELILRENYEFPLVEAARLTGIDEKQLSDSIYQTLSDFPGKNSGDKHAYFLLTCRMKRYIFEGEDRNRRFFWATTPFLSRPFFGIMSKIDRDVKINDDFYRRFIAKLNEQVAAIRDENYSSGNVSVSKNFYRFVKNKANALLSRKRKEQLKALFEGRKASKTVSLYKNLILEWESNEVPIDMKVVRKKINDYSLGQLSLIATALLVSAIVTKK
ncbi:asparagine synthase-related protein [Cyclobacterium xiamenense]|uniref:asparagine synthase-related protein n=1 Tax=Cyclobacterium xiamenense TaxID=1297121 RepID=UPI0012B742EA|nr:asparagine synthase-related protein [Cyclobacterium xiamenense]